ncbi:hypothetical protein DFH09DRAFT_1370369 [Mycena vulgaris]|nr:hypothetical protein DFH09DRAFT_1370369 [Mycena vulgaris]
MRKHLCQLQLEQDALVQPHPRRRTYGQQQQHCCALALPALAFKCPQPRGQSTAPPRARGCKCAPSSSGRSLRDTQPLPSIGADSPPVAPFDSDSSLNGERALPAVCALFPAAFARAPPAPHQTPLLRGPVPAPAVTAQAQTRILHPPNLAARGGPRTSSTALITRTHMPMAALAAPVRKPAPRRTRTIRGALQIMMSYDQHSALVYHPHALAAQERDHAFVYDPPAFAAVHAQRENGFAYSPQAGAGESMTTFPPTIRIPNTFAYDAHLVAAATNTRHEKLFVYNPHIHLAAADTHAQAYYPHLIAAHTNGFAGMRASVPSGACPRRGCGRHHGHARAAQPRIIRREIVAAASWTDGGEGEGEAYLRVLVSDVYNPRALVGDTDADRESSLAGASAAVAWERTVRGRVIRMFSSPIAPWGVGMGTKRESTARRARREEGTGRGYPRVLVGVEGGDGDEEPYARDDAYMGEEAEYVTYADEDVAMGSVTVWGEDEEYAAMVALIVWDEAHDPSDSTSHACDDTETLHDSNCDYDEQDARASRARSPWRFDAGFGAVVDDALAPKDGERVPDDGSGVAGQQQERDALVPCQTGGTQRSPSPPLTAS